MSDTHAYIDRAHYVVRSVINELEAAHHQYASFNSAHEGYAVIAEELDELWDDVKQDNVEHAKKEAIQVAAMAIRFCLDL